MAPVSYTHLDVYKRQGETYGEDPTLAAAMGTAYVKGLQDKHRMSCLLYSSRCV